jgi:hypothetical protein
MVDVGAGMRFETKAPPHPCLLPRGGEGARRADEGAAAAVSPSDCWGR